MKRRTLITAAVAAGLMSAAFGTSNASASCHAQFYMPQGPYTIYHYTPLDAVSVTSRVHLSCSRALQISARAYNTPHLRIIVGPQFGPGGFGGPFRLGSYRCYLHSRGSDFRNAECWRGSEDVWFSDHRDYWPYLDPGFHSPVLRP